MDRIVHGVNKLTCAFYDAPHIVCDNQLLAIVALPQAIQRWTKTTKPPQTKPHRTTLSHMLTRTRSILCPMCRPQEDQPPASPPRVVIPKLPAILIPQNPIASQDEPIARLTRSRFPTMDRSPPGANKTTDTAPITRRTCSQTAALASVVTPSQADQRRYPAKFLQILAMPVQDKTSGKLLQCHKLRKHPKFARIWNTSYTNGLGQLCQGIGKVSKGPKHQHVEGTNTFHLIKFADIPRDR